MKNKMGLCLKCILKKNMIRFGDKWGDYVMKTVKGGRVAIRTNDKIAPLFPHL